MNDNVRKIFDILGVEPGEEFKADNEKIYRINEDLSIKVKSDNGWLYTTYINIASLLNGTYRIIKLPKKKKLRDFTRDDWEKWKHKYCSSYNSCYGCIFENVACSKRSKSWFSHKDFYSDKFLNQEIEVEE